MGKSKEARSKEGKNKEERRGREGEKVGRGMGKPGKVKGDRQRRTEKKQNY